MLAAVVTEFDRPPALQEVPEPMAAGPDEVVVEVLAAGLHPRVRSQANGSHYTSTDDLPLVPGIDGVGRAPDGSLRYFVLPDTTLGSMAERTVIDLRRSLELPPGSEVHALAAGMNPGMSSWVALRRRVELEPGQTVVVLGAYGNAGRMAVEIARHLGAGQVIGIGRGAIDPAAAEADVVLDYLWGQPAVETMIALVRGRRDSARRLAWIQIGSVAGPTIELPSAALRSANLQIMGSGQGSVSTAGILEELPALAAELSRGSFTVNPRPVPLADVERAWGEPAAGSERVVITPHGTI